MSWLCYVRAVADPAFDGVYARVDFDWIHWLRFYPDGTVLSASSEPAQVGAILCWLQADERETPLSRGQWSRAGQSIELATTSRRGVVEYSGKIADDCLALDIRSQINEYRASDQLFQWVPCSPGDLAGDWTLAIEAGRLADALALGRIEEPALRLAAVLGSAPAAMAVKLRLEQRTRNLSARVRRLARDAGDQACLFLAVAVLANRLAQNELPMLDALKAHVLAPLSRDQLQAALGAGAAEAIYDGEAEELLEDLLQEVIAGGKARSLVSRALALVTPRRLTRTFEDTLVPWLLGYYDPRTGRSLVEKSALFDDWARRPDGSSALTRDEARLIADVSAVDAPDDALLIYADWLEERGNPKRAYLRVLARLHDSHIEPAVIVALGQRWRDLAELGT